LQGDWSSDVCSSDLKRSPPGVVGAPDRSREAEAAPRVTASTEGARSAFGPLVGRAHVAAPGELWRSSSTPRNQTAKVRARPPRRSEERRVGKESGQA